MPSARERWTAPPTLREVPGGPDDLIWLGGEPIETSDAMSWATLPRCGAVVTFCGTVRDCSEGRPGVTGLEYEAYEEYAGPRMLEVASSARRRWPALGRIALLHRVGSLVVGEVAVVVVVSAPHRGDAFAAASFCIDTLKATVPIWKFERWRDGAAWVSACELHESAGPPPPPLAQETAP